MQNVAQIHVRVALYVCVCVCDGNVIYWKRLWKASACKCGRGWYMELHEMRSRAYCILFMAQMKAKKTENRKPRGKVRKT